MRVCMNDEGMDAVGKKGALPLWAREKGKQVVHDKKVSPRRSTRAYPAA